MRDDVEQTRRVLLAQCGDREALDGLLRSVQEPLFRYVRGLVGQRSALAEDVLQEALVRICQKIGWLREPGLFQAWAYRIATREAWKALRHDRRFQTQDELLLDEFPAPLEDELHFELIQALPALLEQVSPACRAPLLLHYIDGLTFVEIASVLDIAIGTVKSRIAYGLSLLRKRLHPEREVFS